MTTYLRINGKLFLTSSGINTKVGNPNDSVPAGCALVTGVPDGDPTGYSHYYCPPRNKAGKTPGYYKLYDDNYVSLPYCDNVNSTTEYSFYAYGHYLSNGTTINKYRDAANAVGCKPGTGPGVV